MSCPICQKQSVEAYRPFCSKRCADVDLGRWLNGSYTIPEGISDQDDEAINPADTERWRD